MRVLLPILLLACSTPSPVEERPTEQASGPPAPIALSLCLPSHTVPGETAQFGVSAATPGATVYLVRGGRPGPRQTCFGGGACTNLSNPALLGRGPAGMDGLATIGVAVPARAPIGGSTYVQAFEVRAGGAVASQVSQVTLVAADDDGFCAAADVCTFPDLDGDLLGDRCDADVDGDRFPPPRDCDDLDPAVYPGSPSCPLTEPTTCQTLFTEGYSSDGMYWLDPDGSGALPPFEGYCDMDRDGGGWTLVMRGNEATSGGTDWNNAVGAILPAGAGTVGDATWKLDDATIRALLTQGYRVEGDGYVEASRFVSADCPWQQNGSVLRHPACSACFLDPDLTTPDAPHLSLAGHWYGIACGTGVIITAHQGSGVFVGWALAPAGHPLDGNGDGRWDTCDGQPGPHRPEMTDTTDCNLAMWVR